jgi:UDP-glucose 4-epimerase
MRNDAQREQNDAHLRALDHLDRAPGFDAFKLGSGRGYSVAEVLAACRTHCNGKPEAKYVGRRAGDPAILVASNASASAELQWQPAHTLSHCVVDAATWYEKSA